MNPSTLIGMIFGIGLLAAVLLFAAEDPVAYINLPGLGIVIGGTLAATFISYPLREVVRVFGLLGIVFRNERLYTRDDMDELVQMARLWFRNDLRAVERALDRVRNPFLRTGVQLVIDGTPEDDILDLLRWRIARLRTREHAEAQMFRSIATFAPAFGMIGTLVGLINMLFVLETSDMTVIGQHMAIALLTTFYGILLANLVFKPVAVKLERRTEERLIAMNMVLEGVALICQKRNPAFVRETLKSFMAEYQDEIREAPGRDPATRGAGPNG
ncbi:MotA/TolQ/ExbB proton channel family protein [Aquisalimonas sp.]|uniref:motility protein A n=1 Tax=unclassified Aquisalimonas TaxID=2644645 RepID=UPI0025C0FB3F|nr:MotA/TolQ/ExbB proton channel family protein [Aquisalimonas sp.]